MRIESVEIRVNDPKKASQTLTALGLCNPLKDELIFHGGYVLRLRQIDAYAPASITISGYITEMIPKLTKAGITWTNNGDSIEFRVDSNLEVRLNDRLPEEATISDVKAAKNGRIYFTYEDKNYSIPARAAYNDVLIKLPVGKIIKVSGWHETTSLRPIGIHAPTIFRAKPDPDQQTGHRGPKK